MIGLTLTAPIINAANRVKEKEEKQLALDEKAAAKKRKLEWYEKFRWFKSSEGFLVVGGRDATTNEIIIKKHTQKGDVVFHTDMAGSPFFVVKKDSISKDSRKSKDTESKDVEIGEDTLIEVADATCSYSRAWKLGLSILDVFYVKPEQVTKKAQSGEFMPKGAFMVYGKTEYLRPRLEMAIGVKDDLVIGGPINAVKKQTDKFKIIIPGKKKKSEIAKKIKHKLGGDLDEITKFLPAGGCEIK